MMVLSFSLSIVQSFGSFCSWYIFPGLPESYKLCSSVNVATLELSTVFEKIDPGWRGVDICCLFLP